MNVIIRPEVLGPVAMLGTVLRRDTSPGALPNEFVVRLTDGRTVALRSTEFYPAH